MTDAGCEACQIVPLPATSCHAVVFVQVSPEVVRELEQAVPRDGRPNSTTVVAAAAAAGQVQKIVVESRVGQHVTEDVFNMPPVPMMDED